MTYLIALVVAIALTAVVLLSFGSSLNERQFLINQKESEILTAATSLNMSLRERQTYDFSFLNRTGWQDTFRENYSKPYFLNDFTIYFDNFEDGYYACLLNENAHPESSIYLAAIKVENERDFIKIDSDCGTAESGLAIYIKQGG